MFFTLHVSFVKKDNVSPSSVNFSFYCSVILTLCVLFLCFYVSNRSLSQYNMVKDPMHSL